MRLYHFTCEHGHKRIGNPGTLRPYQHFLFGFKVLWLTSEPWPDRDETGLTQKIVKCDRMSYRYVVTDTGAARPWLESDERLLADPSLVRDLEEFGATEQWWISSEPMRGRLA